VKQKSSTKKGIIAAVVTTVLGLSVSLAVLFLSPKQFKLSPEYYGSSEQIELTNAEYDQLVEAKKSFVVFIDLGNCVTANEISGYIQQIADEHQVQFYHIMADDAKEGSLHESVKFYPSVALVKEGKIAEFIHADEEEYSSMYHSQTDLNNWFNQYIIWE
jgi:hypothetical protein